MLNLDNKFKNIFKIDSEFTFSCGGRFEILGNHTDHNYGKCIAATANLSISAAISRRNDNKINFFSEGFEPFEINITDFSYYSNESKSAAMIRGIAKYLFERNYKIGGFNAYVTSSIFPGAGVSSSAAFELLIGGLFNKLFNDNEIPLITLCKAGQFAENEYYGKKSGLLDQIGVAYGGLVSIDFKDINNPLVENFDFPFDDLHFVLINTGGDHSSLNDLYSSIPNDMISTANKCGVSRLRETNLEIIEKNKNKLNDMEYKRAIHFYSENERVDIAISAIKSKDETTFLNAINESRISSTNNLKNMMVEGNYVGSPLEACDRAMEILGLDGGAIKINGGGFAGSCIALVKEQKFDKFMTEMEKYYNKDNVIEIFVRKTGPSVL